MASYQRLGNWAYCVANKSIRNMPGTVNRWGGGGGEPCKSEEDQISQMNQQDPIQPDSREITGLKQPRGQKPTGLISTFVPWSFGWLGEKGPRNPSQPSAEYHLVPETRNCTNNKRKTPK